MLDKFHELEFMLIVFANKKNKFPRILNIGVQKRGEDQLL